MAVSVSKPSPRNRRAFVRTQVPRAESVASWIILVLLAGVGAVILIKGRHYDMDRFALRPEALLSTVAGVEGKSGTVSAALSDGRPVKTAVAQPLRAPGGTYDDYEAEMTADLASQSASGALQNEPLQPGVTGVVPMAPTEFYSPDTLFEKIDGRAPAYLGFNFQQLRCRSFTVTGAEDSYVDVFEYRFDTPINAFGMFALERDPAGQPLDFVTDGYAGGMGFYFRQGVYYVQILASDQNAETLAIARAIAEDRAKTLPADDTGLAARRLLPAEGLDPASVAFVAENALGQSFLKNVFQATYDFEGNQLSFFLMVGPLEEAASAWQAYRDFMNKIGGQVTALPDVDGAKLFQAEAFGSWSVIYQREGEIGGVTDASDVGVARRFVEQQLKRGAQ